MRTSIFLLLVSLIFYTLPAWADQLIIEPDMGRAPIINAINDTHHSLDLVMYGFTDEQLLNAIMRQQANGRTVNIILERSPYKTENENEKTIQAFTRNKINWQGNIPPFRLIHQKTLIIDERKAVVMTFNFTHSSFKNERNFALVIDDPTRVNEIAGVFSADWNHKPSHYRSPNLIYSPDDSRNKLLSLLKQANKSIKIYAQNINDYKIVGALAQAAHHGVQIDILTSAKLREKQANYLARAGVNVHQSKHLYIHAKVFIIDNRKAVIGSINLTRASLDDNRELAVVTEDPVVIKQLTAIFDKDWDSAADTTKNRIQAVLFDKRTIRHALHLLEQLIKD